MATVITNLLSAIPVFGQDIVELIWGGLKTVEPQYGDVLLKILLIAGKSPYLGIAYGLFLIFISIIYVRIAKPPLQVCPVCDFSSKETVVVLLSWLFLYKKSTCALAFIKAKAQACLLKVKNKLMFYFFPVLKAAQTFINLKFSLIFFFKVGKIKEVWVPTILVRDPKRAERRKSAGVCGRSISTFESPQRLHAGDLTQAYLVGLFEGDGFFSISKKGKYLTYELGIELSIRDAQLIYKLKRLLGVGVVSFRKRGPIEMVTLRIRDKDHLKKIILPIFDKYPMFSNKQYDYLRFRDALLSGIIYSADLPEYSRSNEPLNTVDSIINTFYFPAWLVGFIEAEGCFSIYEQREDSFVASFDISQTSGEIIISAIRKYLSFTTTIYLDKTNCYKLKVTSARSIENVIKFLDRAPLKLLGNKKLQYLLWIKQLRTIPRYYKKINIPSKY